MKVTVRKWDASEYLDSPEIIREYLTAAFEEGDSELIMIAIGNIVRAQGMSETARKANLSPQNLYNALSPGGSPKFETVRKIIEAFGCKLTRELGTNTIKKPEENRLIMSVRLSKGERIQKNRDNCEVRELLIGSHKCKWAESAEHGTNTGKDIIRYEKNFALCVAKKLK